jgi:hypothetical protein
MFILCSLMNAATQHLARDMFALTPNSMADERTQSVFTWLNSALRNRMHVATVARYNTVRQWRMQDKLEVCSRPTPNPASRAETLLFQKPIRIPTVKFRNMEETIFKMTGKRKPNVFSNTPSETSAGPAVRAPTAATAAPAPVGSTSAVPAVALDDAPSIDALRAEASTGSDDELSDLDSDDEDLPAQRGDSFEASSIIDLTNPELLDWLSDTPRVAPPPPVTTASARRAATAEATRARPLADDEWV